MSSWEEKADAWIDRLWREDVRNLRIMGLEILLRDLAKRLDRAGIGSDEPDAVG